MGYDGLGEWVGEDLGCFAARKVGQVGQGREQCLSWVCSVHPVEIRVCGGIARSRRVVCGGRWRCLVFGDDVGLRLVTVDACLVHFPIRPGGVDEPELCALARVYEAGADKDCTVGEQRQERGEPPAGAGRVSGTGSGEQRGLVVVEVEGGEGDAPGEAVAVSPGCLHERRT